MISSNELWPKVAKALGLSDTVSENVVKAVIRFEVDCAVVVEIEAYADTQEEGLDKIMLEYRLIECDDG